MHDRRQEVSDLLQGINGLNLGRLPIKARSTPTLVDHCLQSVLAKGRGWSPFHFSRPDLLQHLSTTVFKRCWQKVVGGPRSISTDRRLGSHKVNGSTAAQPPPKRGKVV